MFYPSCGYSIKRIQLFLVQKEKTTGIGHKAAPLGSQEYMGVWDQGTACPIITGTYNPYSHLLAIDWVIATSLESGKGDKCRSS